MKHWPAGCIKSLEVRSIVGVGEVFSYSREIIQSISTTEIILDFFYEDVASVCNF